MISAGDEMQEVATGFTLYADRLVKSGREDKIAQRLFLPKGHDTDKARQLRAKGWITLAALDDADDAAALGCSHILGRNGPDKI
jgi:ATP phosphoribosyltransferase regulatory subunit